MGKTKKILTVDRAASFLGLSVPFTREDLKHAFRKMCLRYHPDNKDTGDEKKFKYGVRCLDVIEENCEFDTDGNYFGTAVRGYDAAIEDMIDVILFSNVVYFYFLQLRFDETKKERVR